MSTFRNRLVYFTGSHFLLILLSYYLTFTQHNHSIHIYTTILSRQHTLSMTKSIKIPVWAEAKDSWIVDYYIEVITGVPAEWMKIDE